MSRTTILWISLILLPLGLAGCREELPPARRPIAVLYGSPVRLAELDAYLSVNVPGGTSDGVDDDESDRVLSRMLDNFIDERLLLAEAERGGIQVSEAEVALFLQAGPDEDETSTVDPEEVRRVLMVQKYREAFVTDLPEPRPEEIAAYVEQHRASLSTGGTVVLRSLLLSSPDLARRVHRQIRARQITFAEAVAAHAELPGQGVPLEMSLDELPEEVRVAIQDLRPGRVTKPIRLHGNSYLFLLERRPERANDDEKMADRAREEMLRARREAALTQLLENLRAAAEVRIVERNLPFRYVPE